MKDAGDGGELKHHVECRNFGKNKEKDGKENEKIYSGRSSLYKSFGKNGSKKRTADIVLDSLWYRNECKRYGNMGKGPCRL